MKKVSIIPEPKKIVFKDRWYRFDGINNVPGFIRKEFKIPYGSFKVENVNKNGNGVEIIDKKIKIWGDENICYSTLCQLIMQNPGHLPEISIEEDFKFSFRGYHLDLPRGGVPTLEYFKKILRLLFISKYNFFAIYFEDLFPWEKYPQIGKERGRLSRGEIKAIVEYGKELGIEVFPSLEFAGHMEQIPMLPDFYKYSEWYRGNEGCLNVSDPEARKFFGAISWK